MFTRRHILKVAAGTALFSALPFGARAGAVRVETGPAFGSAWRLVLPNTADATFARARIEAIVQRIDGRMSPYHSKSELARFNAASLAAKPVRISHETRAVVAAALELAKASDGAFDPTSAPIGRRYGFGSMLISATRPAAHYKDLILNGRTLHSRRSGLSLDLCAIAKGHALDEMTKALDGLDFLLELGGEISARGKHPTGRAWRMGIDHPQIHPQSHPQGTKLHRIIEADGFVLATSGNVRNGYGAFAQRYGHVIDPRTQSPVANAVASVSVLAQGGQLADGLATAAMVLGPGAADEMLGAFDARALFLMHDGAGLKEVDVRGFLSKRST